MDTPEPAAESAPAAPDAARWWTLGAVCVATFMLLLDITIVNVALPDIAVDLGSSFEDLQWVVDAYALTLAAFMLTAGTLADLLGRRRIFVAGLAVFTFASLLCGLAAEPLVLNLARALQGVGGAAMFATSLALLATAFTGRERGMALGVWGATIGGSVAIGPLVGGALTEHVGWESIFFVNLPIGAAAIAVTLRMVGESRDPGARRIDWLGLATFSGGLFLLVFALVRGNAEGWESTPIVAMLVGAVVLLVAFLAVERAQERPMLDLSLFGRPAFAGVSIAAFALHSGMFAMFLNLTLYMQNTLGFSPLETGLRFLPLTVVSFVAAAVSGNLTSRLPTRWLLGAGLTLVGIGLLLMRGLDAGSEWTDLLAGFLVAGLGVGITNPAIAATAVGVVDPWRTGMASGINNTFRQVGIATGIAGLGALFQHLLSGKVAGVPAQELAQGRVPAGVDVQQFLTVYTDALNDLLLLGGCVTLAGALAAVVLVRDRDFVTSHQ